MSSNRSSNRSNRSQGSRRYNGNNNSQTSQSTRRNSNNSNSNRNSNTNRGSSSNGNTKAKFYVGPTGADGFNKVIKELKDECAQNHIEMTYILQNEKKRDHDKPELKPATVTRAQIAAADTADQPDLEEKRETEIRRNELIFQAEMVQWNAEDATRQNKRNELCGKLRSRMNHMVKALIEEEADYPSKGYEDPVWLIKRIRDTCINYKGTKHPCSLLLNSIKHLADLKQHPGEETKDWIDRIKTATSTMMDCFNKIWKAEDSAYEGQDKDDQAKTRKKAVQTFKA